MTYMITDANWQPLIKDPYLTEEDCHKAAQANNITTYEVHRSDIVKLMNTPDDQLGSMISKRDRAAFMVEWNKRFA